VAAETRNGDREDQQGDHDESVDAPRAAGMNGSGHGAIVNPLGRLDRLLKNSLRAEQAYKLLAQRDYAAHIPWRLARCFGAFFSSLWSRPAPWHL